MCKNEQNLSRSFFYIIFFPYRTLHLPYTGRRRGPWWGRAEERPPAAAALAAFERRESRPARQPASHTMRGRVVQAVALAACERRASTPAPSQPATRRGLWKMSTKNFRISQDNRSRLCMLPSPETIGSCCDFDRDGTSTWAFVHGWIISLEAGEPTHRPTWWSVVSERQILTEHGPSRPCCDRDTHELRNTPFTT